MENLRIVETKKHCGDTYGTGDRHTVTVFNAVRPYTIEDIWDKQYKRGTDPANYYSQEVIEQGVTVETFNSRTNAEIFVNAFNNLNK